ncbi:hypothetical protein [Microscilla marina]|uniref:Uncharacterized protein n=1 Tax=Microscilla marina ATCC 23134 TaxID=313606 RepID=A1ZUQ5_MICM2|nr:hypothetical protein [Microscilla marina]EAY25941.1 hypothetical protein M23134_00895 [Microscilla marina ATCC 23134]
MIKLNVSQIDSKEDPVIECYNDITRIPLNINLNNQILPQHTTTYDNIDEGNFIEFRFNEVGKLYEITVIALNNDSVLETDRINVQKVDNSLYDFFHSEKHARKRSTMKVQILKASESICVTLGASEYIRYYKAADHLYIGVDNAGVFRSFFLDQLSKENVNDIFGELI